MVGLLAATRIDSWPAITIIHDMLYPAQKSLRCSTVFGVMAQREWARIRLLRP